MGASLDVRNMSDDDLYELFAAADDHNDAELAGMCAAEIQRRAAGPCPTTHSLPKWLLWLPKGMWHTKPGGGGEGLS
jgi:hypothetical protein